ncbi:MAG: SAM-dependent methyltransferase [Scytolyngbya sp. HA4215-MV1]|jgi:hypothetical protein|nr:SAM-dependent methyltransferase [Scytolyngbya sp. HA4215-MV1]
MGFKLEQVVPWGRSLDEYRHMFDLRPEDLKQRILDCAGGPASFNAEMTQQGYSVISCDPLYQFSADDIAQRIQATYPVIVEGVARHLENYVWHTVQTPEQLGQIRMAAMRQFLQDFAIGRQQGRYCLDELPKLSFASQQFDLALCSHLLFTYSDSLSLTFHLDAIRELCRVAAIVRIFPLLNISGEVSIFLQPVMETFSQQGYEVLIQQVPYEFQRGGNQLLQVRRID